jgi:hypothetical protein
MDKYKPARLFHSALSDNSERNAGQAMMKAVKPESNTAPSNLPMKVSATARCAKVRWRDRE